MLQSLCIAWQRAGQGSDLQGHLLKAQAVQETAGVAEGQLG